MSRAAKARGWAHKTPRELRDAAARLDYSLGDAARSRLWVLFSAAMDFNESACAESLDRASLMLTEPWQYGDGLEMLSRLLIQIDRLESPIEECAAEATE